MKLKGAIFCLYSEVTISDKATIISDRGKIKEVLDENCHLENCRYYTISEKPIGYDMDKTDLLPYFAKVTEDLPGSCRKLKPAVYENCQLTTNFPNNYLVFKDLKTGKELKIAMNSHTYEPLT